MPPFYHRGNDRDQTRLFVSNCHPEHHKPERCFRASKKKTNLKGFLFFKSGNGISGKFVARERMTIRPVFLASSRALNFSPRHCFEVCEVAFNMLPPVFLEQCAHSPRAIPVERAEPPYRVFCFIRIRLRAKFRRPVYWPCPEFRIAPPPLGHQREL